MLQAVVTRSVSTGRSAASVVKASRVGSNSLANSKSAVSARVVSLAEAATRQTSRMAVMRFYASKPAPPADQEQVWEDLDGVKDFYDPRWDKEQSEEEDLGGLFDDMSDEEYSRLLGLVRGAQGEQPRFEKGAYEQDKMTSLASSANSAAKPTLAEKAKVVASKSVNEMSLDGSAAAVRFRIGTLRLPEALLERIRNVLKGYPRQWLKRDAEALSAALRARTVEQVTGRRLRREERKVGKFDEAKASMIGLNADPIEYNKHQSMAYAAHRIPGIYSCNTKVFSEIKERFPGFQPKRMMDFGSGPGTTTWAAKEMWSSIRRFQLVEPSESMVAISTQLLEGFPVERRSFLHQGRADKFDLIVASYSLSELSDDSSRRLHVMSLWEHLEPGGLLVVVEPGTPIGFKVARQVRSIILELGESTKQENLKPTINGPCPHAHRCPMSQTTWCHFIQRVERSSTLRSTKSAVQNWENEKFSYMAISKGPLAGEHILADDNPNKDLKWGRLIRQPLKRGGHVILDACLPQGYIERITVSKKHGQDLYTAARKSTWGDVFYFDHVAEAEIANEQMPRRKWREMAKTSKASTPTKPDITSEFVANELAKLGEDED